MTPGGPVTLITGASAGIGAALAEVFAAHGHEVVLVARRFDHLQAVAERIAAGGSRRPRPHILTADLARRDAGDRLAAELAARRLEPANVVNNAAFGLFGEAARLSRAEQLAMIDLNMRTMTDLSLRWVESLAQHRGGILNVASVASFVAGPNMAVYHATKAYVLSLSEALHQELKLQGVRVTALCPGPVATEFQGRSGVPRGYYPRALARSAARVAREGYEGFRQGRRVIIPGFHPKASAALLRVLPRRAAIMFSRAGRALGIP
jgi:short-subunit dehydrogenase